MWQIVYFAVFLCCVVFFFGIFTVTVKVSFWSRFENLFLYYLQGDAALLVANFWTVGIHLMFCGISVSSPVHTWTAGSQDVSRMCKGDGAVSSADNATCKTAEMALWHNDQVNAVKLKVNKPVCLRATLNNLTVSVGLVSTKKTGLCTHCTELYSVLHI